MGLGGNDDRGFGIDRSDRGVTLDDALVGGHLGAVVVGPVAFDDVAAGAATVVWIGSQPPAQFAGITMQPVNLLGPVPAVVSFDRLVVGDLMSRE